MSEKIDRELSSEELEKASGGKLNPASGQLGSAGGQASKPLGAPGVGSDLSDADRDDYGTPGGQLGDASRGKGKK